MARVKKLKRSDIAKILYVYNDGESTLDDIEERTGYTREQMRQCLPVDEIDEREKREVLARYGY